MSRSRAAGSLAHVSWGVQPGGATSDGSVARCMARLRMAAYRPARGEAQPIVPPRHMRRACFGDRASLKSHVLLPAILLPGASSEPSIYECSTRPPPKARGAGVHGVASMQRFRLQRHACL